MKNNRNARQFSSLDVQGKMLVTVLLEFGTFMLVNDKTKFPPKYSSPCPVEVFEIPTPSSNILSASKSSSARSGGIKDWGVPYAAEVVFPAIP